MHRYEYTPTGKERFFGENELIVSKTDMKGIITYGNPVFQRVSGYSEKEMLGAPHSIVRHPNMPRCVFKFLWDNILAGEELFAYVLNMAKGGDHYWVFAHVSPTYNDRREMIGFHSSRRSPERRAIEAIYPVYLALLEEENKHSDPRKGMERSFQMFVDFLTQKKISYGELVFSL